MKAIITAAWYWTRMLPITKTIPKELMPVWDKPVIQYIVEWLVNAWLNDIIIITSQWRQVLEDYFDKNYELEEYLKRKWKLDLLEKINTPKYLANYCFVKQKQMLWFANAILEARQWIESDFFMLTLWDTIFDKKIFQEMINLHEKTKKCVVLLKEIDKKEVYRYWVVKIQNWKIVWLVEKPKIEDAPSNLIAPWIYILPKKIFSLIEKTPISNLWEILLTDTLDMLSKTDDILPYITNYDILDIWTPELWLKANNKILNWEFNF